MDELYINSTRQNTTAGIELKQNPRKYRQYMIYIKNKKVAKYYGLTFRQYVRRQKQAISAILITLAEYTGSVKRD